MFYSISDISLAENLIKFDPFQDRGYYAGSGAYLRPMSWWFTSALEFANEFNESL